jgi:hypothetical protein
MLQLIQAYPAAAPILGDLLAKNLDWPEADEVARRLKALLPPQIAAAGTVGPAVHPQAQQAAAQLVTLIGGMRQQNAALAAQLAAVQGDRSIETQKLGIDAFKAQTERMKAVSDAGQRTRG